MPQPISLHSAPEVPALLKLDADDALALRPLEPGEALEVETNEPIPRGHKVALRGVEGYRLALGEPISENPAPKNRRTVSPALRRRRLASCRKRGRRWWLTSWTAASAIPRSGSAASPCDRRVRYPAFRTRRLPS